MANGFYLNLLKLVTVLVALISIYSWFSARRASQAWLARARLAYQQSTIGASANTQGVRFSAATAQVIREEFSGYDEASFLLQIYAITPEGQAFLFHASGSDYFLKPISEAALHAVTGK